jgi:hypothetical protein
MKGWKSADVRRACAEFLAATPEILQSPEARNPYLGTQSYAAADLPSYLGKNSSTTKVS